MIKLYKKTVCAMLIAALFLSVAALSACTTPKQHEHVYPSAWERDESEHWHSCIECKSEARGAHLFYDGVCRICNYKSEYALNLAYEGVYAENTLVSYTVSGMGECKDNDIRIPDSYNSLPVTAIKAEAFKGVTTLFSVNIPASVDKIGDYAFQSCANLKALTIAEGVREIGKSAFSSCVKLESVTLPNSVVSLGVSAFSNCSNLVNLGISGGVRVLEGGVFTGCTSLERVSIPDGVESVSALAFQNCTNLKSVEIGSGAERIDAQAFINCEKLQTLRVSQSNASYASANECIFEKTTNKLVLSANLASVRVPSGVSSIDGGAFLNCAAVEEIYIPASLERVDSSAFSRCAKLERVYFGGSAAQWGEIVFNLGNDYLTGANITFNALF